MNFFNKIAGAFVELPAEQPAAVSAPTPHHAIVVSPPLVNSEMIKTISEAALTRPSEYVTFLGVAQKLAGVIPDETTRMKAALATSHSPEAIVRALDVHIAEVDNQIGEFRKTLNAARTSEVLAPRNTVAEKTGENGRLAGEVKALEDRLAALNETVRKNNADIIALSAQADTAEAKIVSTENAFREAAVAVQRDFQARQSFLNSIITAR